VSKLSSALGFVIEERKVGETGLCSAFRYFDVNFFLVCVLAIIRLLDSD